MRSLLKDVEKEVCAFGAETKIIPAEAELAPLLRACIPAGCRAVFVYSEKEKQASAEYILRSLQGFAPLCVCIKDDWTGLFSMPDEVRAAVGYGSAAIFAARFFATVRGGVSIAVPDAPSAEGCFGREAPAPFAGYPLRFPDFVLLSGNCMRHRFGQALAETSLYALCAEELRTDALFRTGGTIFPLWRRSWKRRESAGQKRKRLCLRSFMPLRWEILSAENFRLLRAGEWLNF